MVYRINLYPERATRRRQVRLQLRSTVLFTAAFGIGTALIALVAVSGFLMRERADALAASVEILDARIRAMPAADPDRDAVAALARARAARIDWSPKLAAVAGAIGDDLRLSELRAQAATRGRGPRIEIQGSIRGSSEGLGPVSRFLDSLRADPRIGSRFPSIRLGTLEGTGSGRFQILCEADQQAS